MPTTTTQPPPLNVPDWRGDYEPTEQERAGFDAFRAGATANPCPADLSPPERAEWRRGWWTAWARCYAQGALASRGHGDDVERGGTGRHLWPGGQPPEDWDAPPANPNPQFSAAWEAWATGYNEEESL